MHVLAVGIAPALASALLHSLWQDALLAAAAALALGALARARAAWRHSVAMAFLAAMVAVPAVHCVRLWQQPGASYLHRLLPTWMEPGLPGADGLLVQDSSPLAAVVVLVWLSGVACMLVRHARGLRAIAALERGVRLVLPLAWRLRVDELRGALGITRTVAVRLSEDVLAPCAARLLRPVIWLPVSLLTHAPADQLEALLAHELAHIARKDWLWNGLQCVLESLLFFHPAAWWLGRRIRQEREHACDDLAVSVCGDGLPLAEALAALERARQPPPRLVLAARGGSLVRRISRLLSGPPSRGGWGTRAILGALTVAGLLLLTQIGMTFGRLPDLEVRSTTDGVLGPGDWREITANGPDRLRFYRASIDAEGRLTEAYQEDGEDRAIDADVRLWLDDVARHGLELSSPPPGNGDSAEARALDDAFKALVELIAAQPDVVARLGTPVVATSRDVDGNVRLDGTHGDADIRIELRGPRGQAVVAVEAELNDHAWTLQRVEVP